jgi:ribonucleoside-diphosphate reductase alpha chain
VEHAGDRQPFICQAQSLNLFLPSNVHKRDLHQIHWLAWKKGVKSAYYLRSRSLQRAENTYTAQQKSVPLGNDQPTLPLNYEECLSCQ